MVLMEEDFIDASSPGLRIVEESEGEEFPPPPEPLDLDLDIHLPQMANGIKGEFIPPPEPLDFDLGD